MILTYCFPHSIVAGESVPLFASAHDVTEAEVVVERVGATRTELARLPVRLASHELPSDVVAPGCDWPAALEVPTDSGWPSGYYAVTVRGVDARGRLQQGDAFFVVRPAPGRSASMLLPLATNTWNAYNDFGGANLYTGAVRASFARPMAKGLLVKPPGAGRRVASLAGRDERQATHVGYIVLNGLTEWAGSAGWPNYEEPFLRWAERAGYAIDVCTNVDLERDDGLLDGVRLILSVGHDEYWSARQRDAVERHRDAGGHVAFLSGNTCFWQVRTEDGGRTTVCYKQRWADDPVTGTADEALVTLPWAHPMTGRPEATLTGVSFTRGGYSRIGRSVPAGSGGYEVHQPDHWLFAGTGLRRGDLLGAGATVVGYECDGCALTLVDGLPVPTYEDGCPDGFEVLATAPAEPFHRDTLRPVPPGERSEVELSAWCLFGDDGPDAVTRLMAGHAVLGTYTSAGGGTVVTTGCTDWACGLAARDGDVEQVTHNLLRRLGS